MNLVVQEGWSRQNLLPSGDAPVVEMDGLGFCGTHHGWGQQALVVSVEVHAIYSFSEQPYSERRTVEVCR